MKKTVKKLRSRRGETLVETLAAILIAALAFSFLATAAPAAATSPSTMPGPRGRAGSPWRRGPPPSPGALTFIRITGMIIIPEGGSSHDLSGKTKKIGLFPEKPGTK